MARSRRAAAKERKNYIFAAIGVVVLITLSLIVGQFWMAANAEHVELAKGSLCPKDGPSSVTVVIIDRTDAVSPVTLMDIKTRLNDYAKQVPRYGALYIYVADGQSSGAVKHEFFRCNPGQAKDVSRLKASKELVQKSFDAGFAAPLDQALRQLLVIGQAPKSPIMEEVQGAGVEAFSGSALADAPKTLIIVSDLMQNSDRMSLYGGGQANLDFVQRGLAAPLEGVDVELLVINRPAGGVSKAKLIEVWNSYVAASGGHGRWIELTGAN